MGVSAGPAGELREGRHRARPRLRPERAARDRLDRLAAGAGELPLGLRARRARTCGCSRPAAAPTCARRSSAAARCCPCTRANCSAARSAARWRPGTSRATALIDEVGELVITEPMPSMPLFFWGDDDGERLRESYFSMYPGVWRHGDWIRITPARRRGHLRALGLDHQPPGRADGHQRDLPRGAARCDEVLDALVVDVPARTAGGELWMLAVRRARDGVDARRRADGADQAAHPRGLLAAPRAQRGAADRARCRARSRARCSRCRSSAS